MNLQLLRAFAAAIAAAISGGLSSEAIASFFKGEPFFSWFVTLLLLFAFIASFLWLYKERRVFLNTRLYWHEVNPHKALIILLSLPNIVPKRTGDSFPWVLENKRGNTSVMIEGKSLREDIDNLEKEKIMWNWQQLMRGILPHADAGTLKVVYLVGSGSSGDPEQGSYEFLGLAKELLLQYLPNLRVRELEKPVDFEGNFEGLVDCLNQCIEKVRREEGIKEKDIIIDITGGQKTASIAGAMVTLNTRVTFQYVSTTPPDYRVRAYDVSLEFLDTP